MFQLFVNIIVMKAKIKDIVIQIMLNVSVKQKKDLVDQIVTKCVISTIHGKVIIKQIMLICVNLVQRIVMNCVNVKKDMLWIHHQMNVFQKNVQKDQ